MSKSAVEKLKKEYIETVWANSKKMQDYACKKISDCYETEKGYLIEFEKPSISTSFCFGYDDWSDGSDAMDAAENARKNENYFIKENLKSIEKLIENLKEQKIFVKKSFDDALKMKGLVFENYLKIYESERLGCEELSGADVQGLIEMAENEKSKFEKRLKTYLKRYGTSKLNIWTYLRD